MGVEKSQYCANLLRHGGLGNRATVPKTDSELVRISPRLGPQPNAAIARHSEVARPGTVSEAHSFQLFKDS